MASTPLAHLYDLALRTLDGQQRRIAEIRSRVGPALATAALGVALLGGPAIEGVRSGNALAALAFVVAVPALLVTVGAAWLVLQSHPFERDLDVLATEQMLRDRGVLDEAWRYHAAMIGMLGRECRTNWRHIEFADAAFTVLMCGILVMLCGLSVAAVVP